MKAEKARNSEEAIKELPYASHNAKVLAFLAYFVAFVGVSSFLAFLLTAKLCYFIITLIFVIVILVNLTQIRKLKFEKDGVCVEK